MLGKLLVSRLWSIFTGSLSIKRQHITAEKEIWTDSQTAARKTARSLAEVWKNRTGEKVKNLCFLSPEKQDLDEGRKADLKKSVMHTNRYNKKSADLH